MSGAMHVPSFAPACYVVGGEREAARLPVRAEWAIDGGASCADHYDAAWSAVALEHTPS